MSKSLSVSHLLSTIAIAVGFFTYVTGIEQETVVNKMELKSLSKGWIVLTKGIASSLVKSKICLNLCLLR